MVRGGVILITAMMCACSGSAPDERREAEPPPPVVVPPPADRCPATAEAPRPLPRVKPEHERLAYWLEQVGARLDLDEVLLDPAGVASLNAALEVPDETGEAIEVDLRAPMPDALVQGKVDSRLTWLAEQFTGKKYVEADGQPLSAEAQAALAKPAGWRPGPRALRVALAPIENRCGPRARGFYTPTLDLNFDRNNCSTIRPQEVVEVLGAWPNGMQVVRTRYALGWIAADAPLSPPIPADQVARWVDGPRLQTRAATQVTHAGGVTEVPQGTGLVQAEGGVTLATAAGFVAGTVPAGAVAETARPLTRRALLTTAFEYLDTAYGWGGAKNGRDCSRFLLDVFAAFDLDLPRYSGTQAKSASFWIEVGEIKDERERLGLIDAAAERGIVLLAFPGHIMLYLGRDAAGTPMVLHSFAEYLVPCGEGPTQNAKRETLLTVNRVTVSDLELGRGTSRTAFIERLTHIAVIGKPPGVGLQGVATQRVAAPIAVPDADACKDIDEYPIFGSPLRPSAQQPLRLIVTTAQEDAPGELAARRPDGTIERFPLRRLGGPPYAYVATIPTPAAGRWTVAFGDGAQIKGCRTIKVDATRPKAQDGPADGPVWRTRNTWSPQMERFYAAFVESLFDYPVEDDRTWNSLHEILADRDRNLLYDHLGREEDDWMKLQPDCADLPYFLRAYFAWKVGLPMGFRQCSRGRGGQPPRCAELVTSEMPREKPDDEGAVTAFIRRRLKSAVHSSTARTVPSDDDTDVYPIPLAREWLRPGTTYADPYGHLLVLTKWVPQGRDGYGILLAADAQPDGTIGRRRFWRGSFLFSADTREVGAGFKAFRPVVKRDDAWIQLPNAELAKAQGIAPYSTQMYAGTDDDFYDAMEGLINPRPLDPFKRMTSLVEALHEVVRRRVVAIDNGEKFMAERGFRPIDMPDGADIFLTAGPWEDYSTPSRDMRQLISMHTVADFPASVGRRPQLYGITPAEAQALIPKLEAGLAEALAARTIQYTRSDGSAQTLTLADVVGRRKHLETAYNPNDCVEVRWAAPEGSPEAATCKRRAPADQRAKMEKYRPWFAERRRPAR